MREDDDVCSWGRDAGAPITSGGAIATDSLPGARAVVHYKVELPPCFHGDGKDKESF